MSFQPVNMTLWNVRYVTSPVGLPQWWGYISVTDDVAEVSASGYFNASPNLLINNSTLNVGDQIYCVCSDAITSLQVTALSPNVTTTVTPIAAASIATASIQNGAVTTAKIANNAVTSAQLALTAIQYATTAPTLVSALYATPLLLVAAPGAGNVIIPISLAFNYVFATAQYTSGGAVSVQYGSGVHAGGQICSATLAAATLNAYTANEMFNLAPTIGGVSSASINTGLYLSNATNAFATGAGTVQAYVSYIVVPAS